MYIKEKNNLTNYVVIRNETENNSLHFYVKGTDEKSVDNTSNALLDFLNFNKKSNTLRVKYWMNEQVKLENGNVIGVVGSIKKPTDANSEVIGNERINLLKKIVENF